MPSLGLVANVYQECNALPGWLECHLPYFDDVRILHAGPGGAYSDDGTIELLEKWHVPVSFCAIDEGFGAVRTRAVRLSPCDYVCVLDADERFYPVCRELVCEGEPTPAEEVDAILSAYSVREAGRAVDWDRVGQLGANLRVRVGDVYDQGALLREMLEFKPDAICTIRRHWHDLSMRRPTQHWHREPDWQLRIVRNDPSVYFDQHTRMHERLAGAANVLRAGLPRGPCQEHLHFVFKAMEPDQRRHDVAIYDALSEGKAAPKKGTQ